MSRKFAKTLSFFANLLLSLSLAVATFVILDFFNPKLGFLSSTYSIVVIALLSITAVITSILCIVLVTKKKKRHAPVSREGSNED